MEISELDVIKLKDGREGTVIHIYPKDILPQAYEIEFDDGDTETVQEDEIAKVIWSAKDN